MLSSELNITELSNILSNISGGFRSPHDPSFVEANNALFPEFRKLGVITSKDEDADVEQPDKKPQSTIYCNQPLCNDQFEDDTQFQSHMATTHRFTCAQCKKILPTAHLLDLHITERHDSYFAARLSRADTPVYACLVKECEEKFVTPDARKNHCICEHSFPVNYRFEKINRQRKLFDLKPAVATNSIDSSQNRPYIKAFSFGRMPPKTFNNHSKKKPLENVADLKDALSAMEE